MAKIFDRITIILWVLATSAVFNAFHLQELRNSASPFSSACILLLIASLSAIFLGFPSWVKEIGLGRSGWINAIITGIVLNLALVMLFTSLTLGVRPEVSIFSMAILPVLTRYWSHFLGYDGLESWEQKGTATTVVLIAFVSLLPPVFNVSSLNLQEFTYTWARYINSTEFLGNGAMVLSTFLLGLFFSMCRNGTKSGVSLRYFSSIVILLASLISFPTTLFGELSFFGLAPDAQGLAKLKGIFYSHPGFKRHLDSFSYESQLCLAALFGLLFFTFKSFLFLKQAKEMPNSVISFYWTTIFILNGMVWHIYLNKSLTGTALGCYFIQVLIAAPTRGLLKKRTPHFKGLQEVKAISSVA